MTEKNTLTINTNTENLLKETINKELDVNLLVR